MAVVLLSNAPVLLISAMYLILSPRIFADLMIDIFTGLASTLVIRNTVNFVDLFTYNTQYSSLQCQNKQKLIISLCGCILVLH